MQGALDGKAPLTGGGASGTWGISITGNAGTATKLATARTISLAGDVTGSTSFDGSGNATITATVADDSHNHVISNVDGLQDALNTKQANLVSGTNINTINGASILGSGNITVLTSVPAATTDNYGGIKVYLSGTTLTITV